VYEHSMLATKCAYKIAAVLLWIIDMNIWIGNQIALQGWPCGQCHWALMTSRRNRFIGLIDFYEKSRQLPKMIGCLWGIVCSWIKWTDNSWYNCRDSFVVYFYLWYHKEMSLLDPETGDCRSIYWYLCFEYRNISCITINVRSQRR